MKRHVEPALVKPARMAHYVLRVRDLAASARWYEAVLGMKRVHGNGAIEFMTYDDEHHRLALVQTPVTALTPGAPGLDHVAYTLASLEELLATYKRLKTAGIEPVWPINHGLTTSLYYADPDGNRVEFQVENLDTKEELNAYMRSEAFATNPIGVEFDPARLLERYEAGDPLDELRRQGSA
ncbi:MAG: VOC family protein [Pseudomonadales bacterium]|nr:VOC family protein [Pseudomonadales bacterium]